MSVTKSALKTRGSLQPFQYIVDAWADFGVVQSKRCGCSHDKTTRTPECECAALHLGGMIVLPLKPESVLIATMKLANACSQNCGPKMHRELASRSFTDALLRLAGDRVSLQESEIGKSAH